MSGGVVGPPHTKQGQGDGGGGAQALTASNKLSTSRHTHAPAAAGARDRDASATVPTVMTHVHAPASSSGASTPSAVGASLGVVVQMSRLPPQKLATVDRDTPTPSHVTDNASRRGTASVVVSQPLAATQFFPRTDSDVSNVRTKTRLSFSHVSASSSPASSAMPHARSNVPHLTSEKANETLISRMLNWLDIHNQTHPFDSLHSIGIELRRASTLWTLVAIFLSVLAYALPDQRRVEHLVTAVVLLSLLTLSMWFGVVRARQAHFELYRIAQTRIEKIQSLSKNLTTLTSAENSDFAVPSDGFTWVLRDNVLIRVPVNILVPGDIIELNVGETAPCACDLVDVSSTPASNGAAHTAPVARDFGATTTGAPSDIYSLEKNQFVTRHLLEKISTAASPVQRRLKKAGGFPKNVYHQHKKSRRQQRTRLCFRVTECPAEEQLRVILEQKVPPIDFRGAKDVQATAKTEESVLHPLLHRDAHKKKTDARPPKATPTAGRRHEKEVPLRRPRSMFAAQLASIERILNYVSITVTVAVVAVYIVAFADSGLGSMLDAVDVFVVPLIALIVTLDRLPGRVMFPIVCALGNAVIFSEFLEKKKKATRRVLWERFKSILTGSFPYLTITTNPVEILGNVTALCFANKHGVLSESRRTVEHVLSWEDSPVVLDLIRDETSPNGIIFEGEWTDHLSTLKPLGLGCMVNSLCDNEEEALSRMSTIKASSAPHLDPLMLTDRFGDTGGTNTPVGFGPSGNGGGLGDISDEEQRFKERYPSECLCWLGQEIGFEKESVKAKYERGIEIRPKIEYLPNRHTSSMHSVAIRCTESNPQSGIHLFSRGTTSMILKHCRYIWRGGGTSSSARHKITTIKEHQITKIKDIIKHWEHEDLNCVAIAYTPIPLTSEHLFFSDRDTTHSMHKSQSVVFPRHPPLQMKESKQIVRTQQRVDYKSDDETMRSTTSSVRNPTRRIHARSPSTGSPNAVANGFAAASTTKVVPSFQTHVDQFKSRHMHQSSVSSGGGTVSAEPSVRLQLPKRTASGTSLGHSSSWSNLAAITKSDPVADAISQFQNHQILIGVVASRTQPKTEMSDLVLLCEDACIRFVFFSSANIPKSKAFAAALGIDTEWNACLSLAHNMCWLGSAAADPNISKLPRGINTVREHLKTVDNVPLLVSLFADCSSDTTLEMVRIFQENGDTVFCCGSSLQEVNTPMLMQADISASLDPRPTNRCTEDVHGGGVYSKCTEYFISSTINSLPCVFPLTHDVRLTKFLKIMEEGRRLILNMQQSFLFASACYLALFLISALAMVLGSVPILRPYQVIWLVWVIIPMLSASLLPTPKQKNLMKIPAEKNVGDLRHKRRVFAYFSARFLPPMLAYFFLFHWILTTGDSRNLSDTVVYFWRNSFCSHASDAVFSLRVLAAQNYALFALVYFFVVLSANFVHRTLSVRAFPPFRNRWWIAAALSCLVLQLLFAVVSLATSSASISVPLPLPQWQHVVFMLAFAVWILFVDILAKRNDAKFSLRNQRRVRLHFNTKLGMHSPQ